MVVVPGDDGLFILFSVIIGLIGRMSEGELTDSFVDGARDLLGVALIIGIARGITVIMNNGGDHRHRAALGRAGGRTDVGAVGVRRS